MLSILQTQPLVTLGAGECVIVEGQPASGLYFLETGEVEVLKNGVRVAEIFDAGAVFGEMSWLLETQPTATVRTLTPCTFRHVTEPRRFLSEHPAVTLHMATILARRIDSLTRYVVEIKQQFGGRADHLGMMDEVLDALAHKHPRRVVRRSMEA